MAKWLARMFRCVRSRDSIPWVTNGIFLKSGVGSLMQPGHKLPNRLTDLVTVRVLVTKISFSTPQHNERPIFVECMLSLGVKDIKSKYIFILLNII